MPRAGHQWRHPSQHQACGQCSYLLFLALKFPKSDYSTGRRKNDSLVPASGLIILMTPCHRREASVRNQCRAISLTWLIWERSGFLTQKLFPRLPRTTPLKDHTLFPEAGKGRSRRSVLPQVSSCPTDIVLKLLTVLHQCSQHHCSTGLICCSSPQDTQVEELFTYKTFRYWKLPPTSYQAAHSLLHHSPLCLPVAQRSQYELSSAWGFHRSWKTQGGKAEFLGSCREEGRMTTEISIHLKHIHTNLWNICVFHATGYIT